MLRYFKWFAAVGALAATTACSAGRHSSAGFRLPADGDVDRGKAAFQDLGCHQCHQVSGADLPRPTIQPPVPVVLGGEVRQEMPDGYLVTSIINPSYRLASYPKDAITVGGKSRMPECSGTITVRQLTDIVAFLQSRYTVRDPALVYPVYMGAPGVGTL
jgi:L-cysteine S-thiosulfotransferase